ncbi:MAG: site-2 protease family protein [Planctomycetota bacterium]|nr:site-2 protease family protein [Planctomycetota bacterium]
MFLIEPQPTAYDLQFRVAGIPVRVHPLFWLMALILGAQGKPGPELLIWVAVVFVSILAHELGHACMGRYFGRNARISLYLMGGLTISQSSAYGLNSGRRRPTANSEILVSAAGPGAGFLLAGLVVMLIVAAGSRITFGWAGWMPTWLLSLVPPLRDARYMDVVLDDLLWVNIFWGLINLLPIYPLDGGQIVRQVLVSRDPRNGTAQALWISVFVAAGMAAFGLLQMHSVFNAVFFGSLAVSSYQALQQTGGGQPW